MAAVLVIALALNLADAAVLRGPSNTSAQSPVQMLNVAAKTESKAPCACVASSPVWKPASDTRTKPRCVFIDLGAADGNTFAEFMNGKYGPVANCPSGEWSAVLVEANPRFNEKLAAVGTSQAVGSVDIKSSTAAYMCEGQTSFFLDTVNTAKNYWGSSMSSSHTDVQASGKTKVTVPTMNLNRVLYEHTIASDWVMVKMDIEGSEFDVLPCVAQSASASLIDRLYLEQHDPSWGLTGTTLAEMEAAKNTLRKKGVDIPNYFSQTL